MSTVVVDVLNKLNGQINWFAAKDNDETFFTMSGARISAKPFVIGFIPPENPVDFVAIENVIEPITTISSNSQQIGKTDPGAAKEVPKEQKTFTPKELRKAYFDGFEQKYGQKPSEETVCFLSAQSTLETGSNLGRSQMSAPNFNVGGIHASHDAGVLSDPCKNSLGPGVNSLPTAPGAGKYFLGVDKETNQEKCAQFEGSNCSNGCFFPVYIKSYGNLKDAATDHVNYMGKFSGAKDAKTPEEYVNSLCPAVSKGSGDCYFSADQDSFNKYLNGIKNGCNQYQKKFQVDLNIQPKEESAIISTENNLNQLQPMTVAARNSYAIETDLENSDGIFDYGRNIRVSEEKQKNVQPQLQALKQQIDLIRNMPPLVMLINPDEFTRSYERSIDDSSKGRQKNIVHMWLERPITISSRGKTAAQYTLNADSTGGITHRNRIHSLSYLNLMSLVGIYRNNGQIYTGPSSGYGEDSIGVPVISMSIFIYYDHHLYIGSFDDFEVSDSAEAPFNLNYSFKFTVRYDASSLLASGAKPGSAAPDEIRSNIFIDGIQARQNEQRAQESTKFANQVNSIQSNPGVSSSGPLTETYESGRFPEETATSIVLNSNSLEKSPKTDNLVFPTDRKTKKASAAKPAPTVISSGVVDRGDGVLIDSETGAPI